MVDGEPLLDLAYVEDSRAESDMNVVVTGGGRLVEVQATAEGQTFSRAELDTLLDLAEAGVAGADGGAAGGGGVKVVLATGNRDKVSELVPLLPGADVSGAPEGFDVEETGVTLLQNAWIKAAALRERVRRRHRRAGRRLRPRGARPRRPAGRVQRALRRPRRHLRRQLPPAARGAGGGGGARRRPSSRCWWASVPGDRMLVSCGTCSGTIAPALRGSGGFGYDPVFVPEGERRSMAELTREEKAAISHRGRAARRMAALLDLS